MLATRDCLWLSTCQMILLLNIFSTGSEVGWCSYFSAQEVWLIYKNLNSVQLICVNADTLTGSYMHSLWQSCYVEIETT
ncbi:hypothetical protein Pint_11079 [Pistacia integerrima]|uniref:Uncharacterized protein n=2 Tax=Pistacia TaxID=55512 RepID=A0ACC1A5M2_9ROSI|nr:hypothetical protein Pint_11079 [Pistacia integerrima]KAJ0081091.1 hypothetical protein Patl1_11242 [Pistacia atlantica]